MSLPTQPPSQTVVAVHPGTSGWAVYAVQQMVNAAGSSPPLVADGAFGQLTEAAVLRFQRDHGLHPDGVAGPVTQGRGVALIILACEKAVAVPTGLMRGVTLNEGGGLVTTVNDDIVGGVDCGDVQERCYGPPFSMTALRGAFDPRASLFRAAADFITRRDGYLNARWVGGSHERAGKVAALAHNWPAGARYYAAEGHAPDPDAPCGWLPKDPVHFPDGAVVRTRQDWCEFYAVGGVHGPGRVVRFVTAWR